MADAMGSEPMDISDDTAPSAPLTSKQRTREEQIASLHLQCPGWADALAAFARSGGFAGCGTPLPDQPLHVIWGDNDRILRAPLKEQALAILREPVETFEHCGHLPHLDNPQRVADRCVDRLSP